MKVTGVNHITLAVRDLEQSVDFYVELLGCTPVATWEQGAYLLAGTIWLCLSVDYKLHEEILPEYTHIAFDIEKKNFATLADKIKKANTTLWRENTSEGDSLYFLDPNGHKLEIHASTLQARVKTCRKEPYSGMVFFEEFLSGQNGILNRLELFQRLNKYFNAEADKTNVFSIPTETKRIPPRLIRLRDVPAYLGMNINLFNAEVRPYLQPIRIGEQGVAFDREDLDAWVDQYKMQQQNLPAGKHLWLTHQINLKRNKLQKEQADSDFKAVLDLIKRKKSRCKENY